MRMKQRLNNLIVALSDVADDPEQFQASFEAAFAERVKQRRAAREEARKRAEKRIRVYLLDGNDIRLRQKGERWIAEHFDLDVSTQGDSAMEALADLLSLSIEHVASLFKLGQDALDIVPHYDFIKRYGGAEEWEERFRKAVNDKLSEQVCDAPQEQDNQKKTAPSVMQAFDSIFERFINSLTPSEFSLAAQELDWVDRLRKEYNENLIPLVLTRVHVTIKSDADGIILRFIGDMELNGLAVVIYRLDNGEKEAEKSRLITRTIKGNEVSFTLSDLELTIQELNRVTFRVNIGEGQIEGRF